jgi:hypothetical protein
MDYETGMVLMAAVVGVEQVCAIGMRATTLHANMRRVGLRQSFVTSRWKSGGSFVWEIPLALLGNAVFILLSWVGLAFSALWYLHKIWSAQGEPPRVKELRWRVRNFDLDAANVIALHLDMLEVVRGQALTVDERRMATTHLLHDPEELSSNPSVLMNWFERNRRAWALGADRSTAANHRVLEHGSEGSFGVSSDGVRGTTWGMTFAEVERVHPHIGWHVVGHVAECGASEEDVRLRFMFTRAGALRSVTAIHFQRDLRTAWRRYIAVYGAMTKKFGEATAADPEALQQCWENPGLVGELLKSRPEVIAVEWPHEGRDTKVSLTFNATSGGYAVMLVSKCPRLHDDWGEARERRPR